MQQVAADLKIQLIFATPGQPRGRSRIERLFRTVHDIFLCNLDGYLQRSRRKPTLTLAQLENGSGHFFSRCTIVGHSQKVVKHRYNGGSQAAFCRGWRAPWKNSTCY